MQYRFLLLATTLVASHIAVAQSGESSDCDATSCKTTLRFRPTGIANGAIAACSGQQSMEMVRILADGTRMTRPTPFPSTQIYCDSYGRIRVERAMFPSPPGAKPPVDISLIEIQDPLAGYLYVLDSFHHVAHRLPIRASERGKHEGSPHDVPSAESLGSKFMFGVMLTGKRTTSHTGSTDEAWLDPLTGLVMLRKLTSPTGESTFSVQNYSNAEPDSSLFLVPPGYQLVDELGPFTIEIPRIPGNQQGF